MVQHGGAAASPREAIMLIWPRPGEQLTRLPLSLFNGAGKSPRNTIAIRPIALAAVLPIEVQSATSSI